MKIYISGKVSGIEAEAAKIFKETENRLKQRGLTVINPMELNHKHDKSWHSYMKEDVKALCDCEAIFLLPNWQDSKGAIMEHTLAIWLGLKVYTEETIPLYNKEWSKKGKYA